MTFIIENIDTLPAVIKSTVPRSDDQDLARTITDSANRISDLIKSHGAVLFSGFNLAAPREFNAVCRAGTPNLVDYTAGGSPRTRVYDKIYTSTEYAACQHIQLHCEYSYFSAIPRYIWFFCQTPAVTGGATPIGDMERVLHRLDDALVGKFDRLGVRYIYNLNDGRGFGLGWQQSFETEDADQVEAWLTERRIEFSWNDDGTLHIEIPGPGLRTHDRSGTTVWGNQAVNWCSEALAPDTAAHLLKVYGNPGRFPKHATFGDGSPISQAEIKQILAVLNKKEHIFPWRSGDVLLCDNQRIAHGRQAYSGERRVLVAMAT